MATLLGYRLSEKKGMVIQTTILTVEFLLLSTGLVSTFFMLKKAISPRYLFDMVLGSMIELVNSFRSFFSSPIYTCVFITSVVLLISNFSKFHQPTVDFLNIFQDEIKDADDHDLQFHNNQPQPAKKEEYTIPKRTNSAIAIETVMSFFSRYSHDPILEDTIQDETPIHVKDIEIDCVQKMSFPDISHLTEAREINNIPRSPRTNTTYTNVEEMVDIINHENIKEFDINQEEGEILEDDDSLEATWKAITGGGNNKNKNNVLKKSETWPIEPQQAGMVSSAQSIGSKDLLPPVAARWKHMRKSLTFNDSFSTFRRGGLRGDFSVSQEESNKKFDDFIKKINYERMLQRQESDQRALKNMLNRSR